MRHTVRVTYDNGNTVMTAINGTPDEIRAYYLGKFFNLGCVDDDMHEAVAVEFLRCDGNHCTPRCADVQCWQLDPKA